MRKVRLTETFKFAYDGCRVKTMEKGLVLPENDQAAVLAIVEDRGVFVEELTEKISNEEVSNESRNRKRRN
jgi:hypothetical protein